MSTCNCPALKGHACPLAVEECVARSAARRKPIRWVDLTTYDKGHEPAGSAVGHWQGTWDDFATEVLALALAPLALCRRALTYHHSLLL